MTAYAWPCQQALFSLLTGSSALADLVGTRIYDDAPQSVTFPWLEIGDGQIVPDDTSASDDSSPEVTGDSGVSDFYDLHIWSRYAGKKEIRQISDVLHSLLHEANLTIEGRASALCWIRSERFLRDPDGQTRHSVVSIEIIHRS